MYLASQLLGTNGTRYAKLVSTQMVQNIATTRMYQNPLPIIKTGSGSQCSGCWNNKRSGCTRSVNGV